MHDVAAMEAKKDRSKLHALHYEERIVADTFGYVAVALTTATSQQGVADQLVVFETLIARFCCAWMGSEKDVRDTAQMVPERQFLAVGLNGTAVREGISTNFGAPCYTSDKKFWAAVARLARNATPLVFAPDVVLDLHTFRKEAGLSKQANIHEHWRAAQLRKLLAGAYWGTLERSRSTLRVELMGTHLTIPSDLPTILESTLPRVRLQLEYTKHRGADSSWTRLSIYDATLMAGILIKISTSLEPEAKWETMRFRGTRGDGIGAYPLLRSIVHELDPLKRERVKAAKTAVENGPVVHLPDQVGDPKQHIKRTWNQLALGQFQNSSSRKPANALRVYIARESLVATRDTLAKFLSQYAGTSMAEKEEGYTIEFKAMNKVENERFQSLVDVQEVSQDKNDPLHRFNGLRLQFRCIGATEWLGFTCKYTPGALVTMMNMERIFVKRVGGEADAIIIDKSTMAQAFGYVSTGDIDTDFILFNLLRPEGRLFKRRKHDGRISFKLLKLKVELWVPPKLRGDVRLRYVRARQQLQMGNREGTIWENVSHTELLRQLQSFTAGEPVKTQVTSQTD
ncbi:hypothetical protein A4X13_0g4748 [Tilletia indica]|uniref:Uncharacterized protein n=1 Tax=Tilletia indica TaxID=43049 RepID=A0A8T8SWQ1_9BASI|nr:hypothetical protein A4X13_0g4748 [Tilletia indica]